MHELCVALDVEHGLLEFGMHGVDGFERIVLGNFGKSPTARQFNFGDVEPLVFRAADQSLRGILMRATAEFTLISSNEGTWVLFNHNFSAAPRTASPVCGAKNFVSVRLYSAPQLHRTIVAILGISARDRPFSMAAVFFSASIRVPAADARRIVIGSERPFLYNPVGKLGRTPVRHVLQIARSIRSRATRIATSLRRVRLTQIDETKVLFPV